ncbi:clindamycin resistance transfer factor BtgB, partial [Enterococcus durans]|nr:clindamycin resistance transfer factor BtgB [Enterococcus durans]
IDFAPPSKGTYNNAGSSRQLANYLEHEDLERMEKDIYTEGFFNLTDDNIYKSMVIKDIDSNIGQLLKTDAKFYATHVSPSEKELRAMGSTEKEQAEAMKRYIREVFIPEYAKNFNKELSASDIKFYGKIHFNRSRSDNELNMHCHLIVSRKDQSNKKKLSPLTNHKNTKNGVIKGGFDRVNLFQQAEQGFDKLFNYNRQLSEAFEYYNIMKNSTITNKLRLQKREQNTPKQNFTSEKKDSMQICKHTDKQADMIENIFTNQQENNLENKYDSNSTNFGLSSLFSTLLSTTDINSTDKQQELITKKKKKQRPRLI